MVIYLAVIATLFGWGLHNVIDSHQADIPEWLWWVEVPGPIGLYLLLRKAMDEWGWAWRPFHLLRIVRIPNLNGRWIGSLQSAYSGMDVDYPCSITIRQTWTRIAIILKTETSRSQNLVAGVLINGTDEALLVYEFENEPVAAAPDTMNPFRGHATLRLTREDGVNVLSGDYYSGRGRLTTGTIRVCHGPG